MVVLRKHLNFFEDGKENFAKIGFTVNNTCGGLNMRAF